MGKTTTAIPRGRGSIVARAASGHLKKSALYDHGCTACPRLAKFLAAGREEYPEYFNAPVPPFGDPNGRLVLVGLAPGFHGANASGRPFTGDHAGILLYRTMHAFGFASAPVSTSADDDLRLIDCRINNSVKCVPPENKPLPQEIKTCNHYLAADLKSMSKPSVLLALGSVAHSATLAAFGLKLKDYKFGHAAEYRLPNGHVLLDTYHCSRYNTQTRRLTEEMFTKIFARARHLLNHGFDA
jgi:uracil-DNA glycosylase